MRPTGRENESCSGKHWQDSGNALRSILHDGVLEPLVEMMKGTVQVSLQLHALVVRPHVSYVLMVTG